MIGVVMFEGGCVIMDNVVIKVLVVWKDVGGEVIMFFVDVVVEFNVVFLVLVGEVIVELEVDGIKVVDWFVVLKK